MNGMVRRRSGSSAFHGAGASPIGVCAALPPPSGLRQDGIERIRLYLSVLKKENVYSVFVYCSSALLSKACWTKTPVLPAEREVRPASLIGSFLEAKDFVYTLKDPLIEISGSLNLKELGSKEKYSKQCAKFNNRNRKRKN